MMLSCTGHVKPTHNSGWPTEFSKPAFMKATTTSRGSPFFAIQSRNKVRSLALWSPYKSLYNPTARVVVSAIS